MHKDTFIQTLRLAGLRSTPSRVRILGVLSETDMPIHAQALGALVGDSIDLVTVYRTLASFEEKGIVRRVDIGDGASLYELADDHHHHAVCTNCKRIEEFTVPNDEKIVAAALKRVKHFASISRHSFELFGLCTRCSRK